MDNKKQIPSKEEVEKQAAELNSNPNDSWKYKVIKTKYRHRIMIVDEVGAEAGWLL